ncbi:MAG: glucose-1-phosphate adenylyltransferase [Clostridia bacterium]|nr:glucose-1-phosphate adenylyltransferase [Clostridia bacterium]
MYSIECVAMLLAGGQGSRLGVLTHEIAKPAVPFGGKYRIIDFPLSNCANSGIYTVGVLTQYRPLELNTYIGSGQPWDMDRLRGGAFVLPPYVTGETGEWYKGTANAIYQNLPFLRQFRPKYVLVLSGDHIYKMDYRRMLNEHKAKKADVSIAVIQVPLEEASRFGIMSADEDGRIFDFAEKPKEPKSTLASMGVYMFSWDVLEKYLEEDEADEKSDNDFGKNVIPRMLADGCHLHAYAFDGYWKDVGTVYSLWEANMDLLGKNPRLNLYDEHWRISSRNEGLPGHYVSPRAEIKDACVAEGCKIYGKVEHSVLFSGAVVEEGAYVKDSIVLPYVHICRNAVVDRAVLADRCEIGEGARIGCEDPNIPWKKNKMCSHGITLVGDRVRVGADVHVGREMMLEKDVPGGKGK